LLEVRPLVLRGNVAAGSADSGFVLRPQMKSCEKGATASSFLHESQMNEAVACVTGFFVLRACESTCNECAQVRGGIIWKSSHAGIVTVDQSANMRLETLVLSDNHIGVSLGFHRPTSDMAHRVFAHNITVFGSTAASTCDASTDCRALGSIGGAAEATGAGCFSVVGNSFRRVGIMTYIVNQEAKLCEANPKLKVCRPPNTPVMKCLLPWDLRLGPMGSRYSESHWSAVTFGHFKSSDCGRKSVAFTHNPTSKDFTYPSYFSGVKWLPSAQADSRIFLNIFRGAKATDDAVSQLAVIDVDGSFMGADIGGGTVVPIVNPALATANCETKPNYFACKSLKLRLLKWEAVGSPSHRVLGSMKLWRQSDGQATWSRGGYDAQCLPGPPEQDRTWNVKSNEYYNLTLFASPPKHHHFFYFNDDPDSLRIALFLSQPFKLEVYVDAKKLDEKTHDTSLMKPARLPTLSDPHGSYAFDPHARRFYFTIKGGTYNGKPAKLGGGVILLRMLLVVQLSLTVSVPLDKFDGESLIDNVALLLKIDRSRIKIVSVQSKAQVAAGGRRLATGTAIIVQIVEKNPAPLPGAPAPPPPPPGANATPAPVAAGDGFSSTSLTELSAIASVLTKTQASGNLSAALKVAVVLDAVATTDPTVPTAVRPSTTTTTTSTIVKATGTIAIDGLPPASKGGGPGETDVVGIIVGVLVGGLFGVVLTVGAVYYRFFYIPASDRLVEIAVQPNDELGMASVGSPVMAHGQPSAGQAFSEP